MIIQALPVPSELATVITRPPEARLISRGEEWRDTWSKLPKALSTTANVLRDRRSVQDHELGQLDDVCQKVAVAAIAGLGSLGLSQKASKLPLWLGAASWLGAMAITPHIINGVVRLKTGVNLNLKYIDSNGNIKPFYQDPNYVPLQIIPFEERNKLYHQFGLPMSDPNRAMILKDKLKQISVQARTWWMLMAGFATPVLSSLICDQLEPPLQKGLHQLNSWQYRTMVLQPALQSQDGKALGKAVQGWFNRHLGQEKEVTAMAQWWNQLPKALLRATGLDQVPVKAFQGQTSEQRFNRVVGHLVQYLKNPDHQEQLSTTLRKHHQSLEATLKPLEALLNHPHLKQVMPMEQQVLLGHQLELVKGTAQSTLEHWQVLLKAARHPKPGQAAHMAQLMEKTSLPYIEQLFRQGQMGRISTLIDSPQRLSQLTNKLSQRRYMDAFKLMGDSPKSLMLKAIDGHVKRQGWLFRYPLLLGGLMVASSAVYLGHFLGKDIIEPETSSSAKKEGGA